MPDPVPPVTTPAVQGDIVLFVRAPGRSEPAIVTTVYQDAPRQNVDLVVFSNERGSAASSILNIAGPVVGEEFPHWEIKHA